jgi:GNAT superfamily N-acetyltransferase
MDGPADGRMDGPMDGPVDGPVDVQLVAPELVRPLRHAVLRPGRPEQESVYPGDDDPRAAHAAVAALRGDRGPGGSGGGGGGAGAGVGVGVGGMVAVGTVLPEAPPWEPGRPDSWRIRGMATVPDRRGQGLGAAVLGALLGHVAANGGGLVWCHARTGARTFYERAGFESSGEVLDLPGIGPHTPMWTTLSVDSPAGGAPTPPPRRPA